MKLKVMVFDPDVSLRQLLKIFLVGLGHEVQVYKDPSACPIYSNLQDNKCCCPRERACADVVFANFKLPTMNAVDFLKLQRARGCKALDANKAVMSASVTRAMEQAMANFGCHHIKKPFRLAEIKEWVEQCKERVVRSRP